MDGKSPKMLEPPADFPIFHSLLPFTFILVHKGLHIHFQFFGNVQAIFYHHIFLYCDRAESNENNIMSRQMINKVAPDCITQLGFVRFVKANPEQGQSISKAYF